MCLPPKPSHRLSSAAESRAIVGIGALMLRACPAGPIGALGVGALAGVGGTILAAGLCFAVPTVTLAWRRRAVRRAPTAKPDVAP